MAKYLSWQSKNHNIVSVDFRKKIDYGWRAHVETLITENKRIDSKVWKNIFFGHNALRPACYECPYKSVHHPGDITIADYWGIEKAAPEFDDNKGTSLVLINSEKGASIFSVVKESITFKETSIEDSMQPALNHPNPKPITREMFWEDFNR